MRYCLILSLVLVALLGLSKVASAQGPTVQVLAPAAGATLMSPELTVEFQVTDFTLMPSTVPLEEAGKRPEVNRPGEGHLHFMLDLQPVVVWDRTEPYTFTNLLPGAHVLMVELVNNDHASFAPPILREVRFQSEAPTTLPVTGRTATLLPTGLIGLGVLAALMALAVRPQQRKMAEGRRRLPLAPPSSRL